MNNMEGSDITFVRVLFVNIPPFAILTKTQKDNSYIFGGVGYSIIKSVMKSLKLSYNVTIHKGFLGEDLGNGSWTGAMGYFVRNEVDLSMFFAHRTPQREKDIDFSTYVTNSEAFFFGGALPPETTDIGSVVRIFNFQVWVSLFVSMCIYIMLSALTVQRKQTSLSISIAPRNDIYAIISAYVAAVFMEGTPRDPGTFRRRFLYGIWWLVILVLANGFCGHTRAMMMSPKESLRIQSLEQLASLSKTISSISVRSSAYEKILRAGSENERQISKYMKRTNQIMDMVSPENLNMLSKGKAVIIYDSLATKSALSQKCAEAGVNNLYVSKTSILSTHSHMFIRKNLSLFKEKLNKRIRWLYEGNLIHKWIENEIRDFYQCLQPDFTSDLETPLSLSSLEDLFLLIIICDAVALLIFFLELLLHKAIHWFSYNNR